MGSLSNRAVIDCIGRTKGCGWSGSELLKLTKNSCLGELWALSSQRWCYSNMRGNDRYFHRWKWPVPHVYSSRARSLPTWQYWLMGIACIPWYAPFDMRALVFLPSGKGACGAVPMQPLDIPLLSLRSRLDAPENAEPSKTAQPAARLDRPDDIAIVNSPLVRTTIFHSPVVEPTNRSKDKDHI